MWFVEVRHVDPGVERGLQLGGELGGDIVVVAVRSTDATSMGKNPSASTRLVPVPVSGRQR